MVMMIVITMMMMTMIMMLVNFVRFYLIKLNYFLKHNILMRSFSIGGWNKISYKQIVLFKTGILDFLNCR